MGLEFDAESMKTLGNSLQILECQRNFLKDLNNLEFLRQIVYLDLTGNAIETVENVDTQLFCMENLKSLDLRGNPIAKTHKYRDQIIMITNENFGFVRKIVKILIF